MAAELMRSVMNKVTALLLVIGGVLVPATCGRSAEDATPPPAAAAAVIDSVFPMDVMLDRFRRDLPEPGSLDSGARTRDELVRAIIADLESADTLGLETLAVDRAEFAWLYYPTAPAARPPYELPPGLAWFQLQEGNRKGVLRALHDLGGRKLGFLGYECDPEPQLEGDNRIWTGCVVTLHPEAGEPRSIALFGGIIERRGRFAVLSYDNDF